MPLAQLLAVRRLQSNHPLLLPPLSNPPSTAGSNSSTTTAAPATRLSTSAPPSLRPGTGVPYRTTFPHLTDHYNDAARAQATDNTVTAADVARDEEGAAATGAEDRPRALLTLEETMTKDTRCYDYSAFSGLPVSRALRTPSPPPLPPSPPDRLGRGDGNREADLAGGDTGSPPPPPPRLRTRGGAKAQAVRYTDPGSPVRAAADTHEGVDGDEEPCLIDKAEAAAVHGEVWRNRDKDREVLPWVAARPEWACPEWAWVRDMVDADEGAHGGAEWEEMMEQDSSASYWTGEGIMGPVGAGARRMKEEMASPAWQHNLDGLSYRTAQSEGDESKDMEEELGVERTVIRRAGAGRARVVSENWESLPRTPTGEARPFPSYYEPDVAECPPAPTQMRRNRIARSRRLTGDPTPNRRAAAKGTSKHFRKANSDQDGAVSPTIQTLSARTLPLSEGFQINICNEQEEDPFSIPVQQPVEHDSNDSMDEIDGCLTGIWNLYANGDRHSRPLLLRDLRRTVAVQEARGVRSTTAERDD